MHINIITHKRTRPLPRLTVRVNTTRIALRNSPLTENVKGLKRNGVHTFPLEHRFTFFFVPDSFSFFTYLFSGFLIFLRFTFALFPQWGHLLPPWVGHLGLAKLCFLLDSRILFASWNRPSQTHSKSLLYAFPVILLFCPSIFQCLASLTATLPSSRIRIRYNILSSSFVPTCSGLQQFINCWSHSLSRITRAFPAPSQNLSLPIYSFKSCPPMCRLHHLPKFFTKYFGPAYFPFIFMYLLCLFHISCTDTCLL